MSNENEIAQLGPLGANDFLKEIGFESIESIKNEALQLIDQSLNNTPSTNEKVEENTKVETNEQIDEQKNEQKQQNKQNQQETQQEEIQPPKELKLQIEIEKFDKDLENIFDENINYIKDDNVTEEEDDEKEKEEEEITTNNLNKKKKIQGIEEEKKKALMSEKTNVDRKKWFSKLMKMEPELRDLRERIDPMSRMETFSDIYGINKDDEREKILQNYALQFIMQHLMSMGYVQSKRKLVKQTGIKYTPRYLLNSRLQTIVRTALREIDPIWDYTISKNTNENLKQNNTNFDYTNHFHNLGLFGDEDENQEDLKSIWEDESEKMIYTEDKKNVKASSLNNLIILLTHETENNPNFIKTFLMTYQSFTTPKILLYKLFERYHVPKMSELNEEEYKKKRQCIQLRVCVVIRLLITNGINDFPPKLIKDLMYFITHTLPEDGNSKLAENLKNLIIRKLENSKVSIQTSQTVAPPEPKVPKNIFSPNLSFFDIDEEEIARQLTLIEFEIYSKIRPPELLNLAWSKSKLKHRAPNVINFIKRFNVVSQWAATIILKKKKIRERARTISWFLRIADHLRKLNNFNGVMSIISGLKCSAIHRLKYSFEEISKKYLDINENLSSELSSQASYSKYRNSLRQVNPPCIPYLGTYLTDLTFIEEGNNDLTNGLINFTKRRLCFDVIFEIQNFQHLGYNLQPVQQIRNFLENFKVLDENTMYSISLKLEPRKARRDEII
ncbi:ras guanine nucleotide exchange factor i-related [Anaeramoeba flamelloides]|uniref:Ras guanine nucleotide exchange factor i-related n=1 Tax=Anaeramoeba flamelloides TaxID=1746091 RepID=A0AAV7ZTS6_9EUKA|nr:ras guanine nucleotide exchange factor i-related [Anaeramoeba flamelloides]